MDGFLINHFHHRDPSYDGQTFQLRIPHALEPTLDLISRTPSLYLPPPSPFFESPLVVVSIDVAFKNAANAVWMDDTSFTFNSSHQHISAFCQTSKRNQSFIVASFHIIILSSSSLFRAIWEATSVSHANIYTTAVLFPSTSFLFAVCSSMDGPVAKIHTQYIPILVSRAYSIHEISLFHPLLPRNLDHYQRCLAYAVCAIAPRASLHHMMPVSRLAHVWPTVVRVGRRMASRAWRTRWKLNYWSWYSVWLT